MTVAAEPWLTLDQFRGGSALEAATDAAIALHGVRALALWQQSVANFARGRELTTALLDAHDRQSIYHYAMSRAACYASHELRTPRASSSPPPANRHTTVSAPPARSMDAMRRKMGWRPR